eukprot:GGOE01044483.1.p1 GENE.GGOE01044483.1~~GGOE01044483.1.p1  ORF type:complete len:500 (-),score=92.92 GGOE01044483.1:162-1556(-)
MATTVRNQPTTLLILTVHGVGPSGQDGAKIHLHHTELARSRDAILQTCLPDFMDRDHLHIDIRDIDWQRDVHQQLKVDETLAKVTPLGIPALRSAINDRAADVLLYAEPQRAVLQRAVQQALNAAFLQYIVEHPERATRKLHVVLLAHSLGSVICYDLLAMTAPPSTSDMHEAEVALAGLPPAPEGAIQARRKAIHSMETTAQQPSSKTLLFPVLALYLLGSPLGMFLASRGHCPGSMAAPFPPHSPGSTYLFNVMHANDPIAYRFEPFLSNALAAYRPVLLPHWATLGPNGKASVVAAVSASTAAGLLHPLAGLATVAASIAGHATHRSVKRLPDVHRHHPVRCSGRFDFVLQTNLTEDLSSYASVLGAHKAYWFSRDLMYFVLMQSLKAMLLPDGSEPAASPAPPLDPRSLPLPHRDPRPTPCALTGFPVLPPCVCPHPLPLSPLLLKAGTPSPLPRVWILT